MNSKDFRKKLVSVLKDNGCIVKFYDPSETSLFSNSRVVIDTFNPDNFMVMSPFKNYYVEFHTSDSDEDFKSKIENFKYEVRKSFIDAFENNNLKINLNLTPFVFFSSLVLLLDKDATVEEEFLYYKGNFYRFIYNDTTSIIKKLLQE